ncbi:MAG: replication protein, partial [Atribacterota bacterium]|nr:replication protein [Atribacterota bacterium]
MSVQLENGYTRIANELLDVVIKTPFIATHLKIVLVCWRYLYGFGRKEAEISESFIAGATGISKRYVSKELKALIESNIIIVVKESTFTSSRIIAFNKNYDQWRYRTTVPQVNDDSTGEPEVHTTVEPQFNTTVEPQFHQERKNKERIKKDKYEQFFDTVWKLYP